VPAIVTPTGYGYTVALFVVLGPRLWYIGSAAGMALPLLLVLDSPFWRRRRALETPGP
jgi:hypothetical protein